MDSINKNQPEDNHQDLIGAEAIERIRAVVKKTDTCFFCTAVTTGGSGATRPMSVQEVDSAGTLWFLSANDSHTNAEIAEEAAVRLFFQGSEHSGFLTLTGRARISMFIVPTDAPGLSWNVLPVAAQIPDKQFTVFYDQVRVPASAMSSRRGWRRPPTRS